MKNNFKKDLFKEADRLTKSIVKKIKPERVILFGSLARGDFDRDSDIDLLVIKKTSLLPWERKWRVFEATSERRVALDALVYTPEEVIDRIERGDIYLEDIFKYGKVLYEKEK